MTPLVLPVVSLLSGKQMVILYSPTPILSDIDFVKAVNWHQEKASLATIISVEKVTSMPHGIVTLRRWQCHKNNEKPQIKHQIISGLYIFESRIFKFILQSSLDMDHLLKNLIEKRDSDDVRCFSNWLDMGEFSEYKEF